MKKSLCVPEASPRKKKNTSTVPFEGKPNKQAWYDSNYEHMLFLALMEITVERLQL